MNEKRFEELDSLRGIAAFSVVLYHGFMLTLLNTQDHSSTKEFIMKMFSYFPFTLLSAGHQAVILFFLLSGFVLSLPFLKSVNVSYWQFLIKRICRIYIPYLVAIFAGYLMRIYFSNGPIGGGLWGAPINWEEIRKHLYLVAMLDQNAFDPVIWSLVHEMRISILFPFIMYFVLNHNWKLVVYNGILLSFAGILLHASFGQVNGFTNYFDTLRYILIFIVGALLAKHRIQILSAYKSLSILPKVIVFALGYYFYCYPGKLASAFGGGDFFNGYLSEWFITIGGAVFIIVSLSELFVSRILLFKPILFMGKISYSVYLYHLIFLLIWLSLAKEFPQVTRTHIWVGTLLGTFIAATLSYNLIELNSIKLGRYLSNLKLRKQKDRKHSHSQAI